MIGIEMDELLNHVRRICQEVVGRQQTKATLVCTAYNPATHAVKGIIQPHGIESGWIPVAAIHVGKGFGILVGPRVGSADALDGQVFDIHPDLGDPDTWVAHHRQFSAADQPPMVQSGEMLLQHESGTRTFFDKDGQLTHMHGPSGNTFVFANDKSITVTHKDSGSMIQIDKDGNHVHDPKGKSITIKGATIALTGNATLNGLPIKTG